MSISHILWKYYKKTAYILVTIKLKHASLGLGDLSPDYNVSLALMEDDNIILQLSWCSDSEVGRTAKPDIYSSTAST